MPDVAPTRAEVTTGFVRDVPRYAATTRLPCAVADSGTRTIFPASAATATLRHTTDRAEPVATVPTCVQPVTFVGDCTVDRLLIARKSSRPSPATTLAGMVTEGVRALAFAVAWPTKVIGDAGAMVVDVV